MTYTPYTFNDRITSIKLSLIKNDVMIIYPQNSSDQSLFHLPEKKQIQNHILVHR